MHVNRSHQMPVLVWVVLKWTSLNRSPVLGLCHQISVQGRGGSLYSEVPCPWKLEPGPGGWGSLYSEVQCIMGNDHIEPPWTDRHDWKHYLSLTSLASGKYLVWPRPNDFGAQLWSGYWKSLFKSYTPNRQVYTERPENIIFLYIYADASVPTILTYYSNDKK